MMDSTEQYYSDLIDQEKAKMRPGLSGEQIERIELEIYRLQGLLQRYQQEALKKS